MNLALKNRLRLYRLRTPPVGSRRFSSSVVDPDLLDVFSLPPEKAIEYFKAKGYAFSWDWKEVWQAAQSTAFTVAKAMRLDILQTIRDELQTAFDEGMMLRDFQKNLEPKLKALGWWGRHEIVDADGVVSSVQLGSPWRLKQIYGTNLQTSYVAGQYRTFMDNVAYRPYWQYQTKHDTQVRPSHRALDGKVFRYDDPFWNTHYPPNDWGCRCGVRALSEREVEQRGLAVNSGEGNLTKGTVTMDGVDYEVTTYTNPKTGLSMTPGPGWGYNPGAVDWKPNMKKYDPDIARLE